MNKYIFMTVFLGIFVVLALPLFADLPGNNYCTKSSDASYGQAYNNGKLTSVCNYGERCLVTGGIANCQKCQKTDGKLIVIILAGNEYNKGFEGRFHRVAEEIKKIFDNDIPRVYGIKVQTYLFEAGENDYPPADCLGIIPPIGVALIHEKVTGQRFTDKIANIYKSANSNDVVLFYYTGHGGKLSMVAYGKAWGLSYREVGINHVLGWIISSKAKKNIFVLSTCHSGSWVDYFRNSEELFHHRLDDKVVVVSSTRGDTLSCGSQNTAYTFTELLAKGDDISFKSIMSKIPTKDSGYYKTGIFSKTRVINELHMYANKGDYLFPDFCQE
ncbi:MAG: caspase family protein [Candidatus Aenigmarchaeota archaeon]|nr:caspase family protein [Candidatus Aenigmarchaeota archaeon]